MKDANAETMHLWVKALIFAITFANLTGWW